MTETKRPEIGEWWRTKMGTIVRVSGKAIDGTWLLEFKSGLIHRDLGDWTGCQHLPDCDSFDWVKPAEVWPKWYMKPQVKSVPVRLYWYDGNIVGRYGHSPPYDQSYYEIRSDGNGGWFVEVPQ